ncbi:MAG: isoprenylcysteine carboxylmethyltransferase family protein, partial [Armatimonadetes bacterium]|nr:isoprenylcysteine carboxylmethyltransferase family protein [Armatimonadota bacterium]
SPGRPEDGRANATEGRRRRARPTRGEPVCVLIPRTKKEIWLNRVRVWLPPVFVLVAVALRRPAWNWWGVPLVVLGEAMRTWAAGHLVKDETLTVGGPYAYLRNPLYLGSLVSTIGFLLVLGDWRLAAAFFVIALAVYIPTVQQEEDYLRRMHGEAFDEYRRRVPLLLPRLRPANLDIEGVRRSRFEWGWVWRNKEHRTWVALGVLFALLAVRGMLGSQ